MKSHSLLRGIFFALTMPLLASSSDAFFIADEGKLFILESGEVYYSSDADFETKVRIGTSDLEIYEVDNYNCDSEDRDHLETSHPFGIFYPCETKKQMPASRGVYHVAMDMGLDRLVWLDEKESRIVARDRKEHTVVSVFEEYALLTDGQIYEGWDDLAGGETVHIEDGKFTYNADEYSASGDIFEQREVVKHFTARGECDQLEAPLTFAMTRLNRNCPMVFFGQYKQGYSTKQKDVLLAGNENELFYLDPTTLEIMANVIPVLRQTSLELTEVISNDGEVVKFADGSEQNLQFHWKDFVESLEFKVDGQEIEKEYSFSEDGKQGEMTFKQEVVGSNLQGHITYDELDNFTLDVSYLKEDELGNCTGYMHIRPKDPLSGQVKFDMTMQGEKLLLDADYQVSDVLAIDINVSHKNLGDNVKVRIILEEDFMDLLKPPVFEVGTKVWKSKFEFDENFRTSAGIEPASFDLYKECHE